MSAKCLKNLPRDVLIRIIHHLPIQDLLNLTQTNLAFYEVNINNKSTLKIILLRFETTFKLCDCNDIWMPIFITHFEQNSHLLSDQMLHAYDNVKYLCYSIFVRARCRFLPTLLNPLDIHLYDAQDAKDFSGLDDEQLPRVESIALLSENRGPVESRDAFGTCFLLSFSFY